MNLAALTPEQRAEIEADKVACLIRYQCGHLQGGERQVCALKLMDSHTEEQREAIKTALKRRAGQ